jgi:mannose-6-phosphate isomerase-like protein (cupin superfamily)
VATLHLTDISEAARTHYHKKLTELQLVLEGEGHMELDGERVALRPMTAVLVKPHCRHRAVGNLRCVIVPVPAFDADDEWFD